MTLISVLLSAFFGGTAVYAEPKVDPPPAEEHARDTHTVLKTYIVEVTGYSSREEETDDTPFVTASGTQVDWGIVATNAYPFGTKLRFPEEFGDQIFTVKDRMNPRYKNRMDIWFPRHEAAYRFGLKNLKVEIVKESSLDLAKL